MERRGSRSLWLALAAMTACGRVGFDERIAITDATSDSTTTDTLVADAPADTAPAPPIHLIQTTATSVGSNVLSVAFPGAVAAGDMVIVAFDGDDTVTFTDSQSNPYATALAPAHSTFGAYVTIAYAITGGSGSDTVTATLAGASGGELRIHEFSGLSGLDPGSAAAGFALGSANPPPDVQIFTPQITTTAANEIVFTFELAGVATTGPESMYASGFDGDITEYELAPTAGAYHPSTELSLSFNGAWIMGAAAFRGQ